MRVGLRGGGVVWRGAFGGLAAGEVAGLAVGDQPVRAGGLEVGLAVVAGVFDQHADAAGHGVVADGGVMTGAVMSRAGRVHRRPWHSAGAGWAAWAAWAAAAIAATFSATAASLRACRASPVSWQA